MKNTIFVNSISTSFENVTPLDYEVNVKIEFRGHGDPRELPPDVIINFIKEKIGNSITFDIESQKK